MINLLLIDYLEILFLGLGLFGKVYYEFGVLLKMVLGLFFVEWV